MLYSKHYTGWLLWPLGGRGPVLLPSGWSWGLCYFDVLPWKGWSHSRSSPSCQAKSHQLLKPHQGAYFILLCLPIPLQRPTMSRLPGPPDSFPLGSWTPEVPPRGGFFSSFFLLEFQPWVRLLRYQLSFRDQGHNSFHPDNWARQDLSQERTTELWGFPWWLRW